MIDLDFANYDLLVGSNRADDICRGERLALLLEDDQTVHFQVDLEGHLESSVS